VDRDLVEQAQRADREAFAILARTRGDTLFGIARRILRDVGLAEDAVQQALIQHLSRRFLIATSATERMVAAAQAAANEVGLDPLLVLAVISVESRFNPIAESGMGAKGLMQIIPKYHLDKLKEVGGEDAVFDPESNIYIGARILQEYVHRTGTLEGGLQFYNGALRDNSAQYARKVLAERDRLQEVLRQRNLRFTLATSAAG